MPKKIKNAKRLTQSKRLAIKAELTTLTRSKAQIAYNALAKKYGITTSTIQHYLRGIRKALRKVSPVVVEPPIPPAEKRTLLPLAPPLPAAKPNGHVTVSIDPDWLEQVTRDEVMNVVRNALRR